MTEKVNQDQRSEIRLTLTLFLLELPADGFSEVGHGGEFGHEVLAVEIAAFEGLEAGFRVVLICELHVDVAFEVVADVVADVEVVNFPMIRQLLKNILIKLLKVLVSCLDLGLWDILLAFGQRDGNRRVVIHVRYEHRRRKRRAIMQPGALVPVATGSDFEVEGAIDPVG
jgi:hypothetical protein